MEPFTRYTLNEQHEPVRCALRHFDRSRCDTRVAWTSIDRYWVSTVFLPFLVLSEDQPLIYETMIEDTERSEPPYWLDYQERYWTFDEAISGHFRACKYAKERVAWALRQDHSSKPVSNRKSRR